MDTTAVRDDELPRGPGQTGQSHEDYLLAVRKNACEPRVPAVAAALGVDEEQARALVYALLG